MNMLTNKVVAVDFCCYLSESQKKIKRNKKETIGQITKWTPQKLWQWLPKSCDSFMWWVCECVLCHWIRNGVRFFELEPYIFSRIHKSCEWKFVISPEMKWHTLNHHSEVVRAAVAEVRVCTRFDLSWLPKFVVDNVIDGRLKRR